MATRSVPVNPPLTGTGIEADVETPGESPAHRGFLLSGALSSRAIGHSSPFSSACGLGAWPRGRQRD